MISKKVSKIMPNIPYSRKILNLDNSSKKTTLKKPIWIQTLRSTSFLMIPITFLFNNFINRPKLTEQKTQLITWFLPPPQTSGVGTMTFLFNNFINRPKLTEQKTQLITWFLPPPQTSGVGTMINSFQS